MNIHRCNTKYIYTIVDVLEQIKGCRELRHLDPVGRRVIVEDNIGSKYYNRAQMGLYYPANKRHKNIELYEKNVRTDRVSCVVCGCVKNADDMFGRFFSKTKLEIMYIGRDRQWGQRPFFIKNICYECHIEFCRFKKRNKLYHEGYNYKLDELYEIAFVADVIKKKCRGKIRQKTFDG